MKKSPPNCRNFHYWPGCPNKLKSRISYHQKPLNAGLGILDWTFHNLFKGYFNQETVAAHLRDIQTISLLKSMSKKKKENEKHI